VRICRRCDRGQRYCARDCAREARRASVREAGRRFRESEAGRAGNSRRQAAHQQRRARRRAAASEAASPRAAGPRVEVAVADVAHARDVVPPETAAASSLALGVTHHGSADSRERRQEEPPLTASVARTERPPAAQGIAVGALERVALLLSRTTAGNERRRRDVCDVCGRALELPRRARTAGSARAGPRRRRGARPRASWRRPPP
jgi:uncharacterized protein YfaQ (DUF2300 family)